MSKKEIVRIVVAITTWVLSAGLDITAGILGIKAEDAQSHAKHVRIIFFECKKRSYSAYVLGMYAAGFVVGGHILTNLLGMCSAPSNSKSSTRKTLALLFLLFAWLTFIPSVGMMVLAAKSNDSSKVVCGISHHNYLYYSTTAPSYASLMPFVTTISNESSKLDCGMLRHNFLFYGGLFCFIHCVFSVAYFARSGSIHF